MGPLRELLAVDHRQTLEFFVQRLQDVSGPRVDVQELLYNASVLAQTDGDRSSTAQRFQQRPALRGQQFSQKLRRSKADARRSL